MIHSLRVTKYVNEKARPVCSFCCVSKAEQVMSVENRNGRRDFVMCKACMMDLASDIRQYILDDNKAALEAIKEERARRYGNGNEETEV